jgi:peptidoglycan/xylan/chitin deacetylase (PgdA/CDA1 family)
MLWVVTYHYIRDFRSTPYPKLKGLDNKAFEAQLDYLRGRYEMASLESALAFLEGEYSPSKDLCLLTFDDGLREHHDFAAPLLQRHGIQGVFALITRCAEGSWVATAHKNHYLLATLSLDVYRRSYEARLRDRTGRVPDPVSRQTLETTYRWDDLETATLKYLINFQTPAHLRDDILSQLLAETLGSEEDLARELYLDFDEACAMQDSGMLIAGHSHTHPALSALGDGQHEEVGNCALRLRSECRAQEIWPFVYPFGKADSFDAQSIRALRDHGFNCAFSTVSGSNSVEDDLFRLHRIDTNEVQGLL